MPRTTTLTPARPAAPRDGGDTAASAARLYPTKNDLPEAARREAVTLLNQGWPTASTCKPSASRPTGT